MPVDPNEPTYCICQQVSYGEMIACDNENCEIEWFHYNCVGLSGPPKGKWYVSFPLIVPTSVQVLSQLRGQEIIDTLINSSVLLHYITRPSVV